MLKSLGFGGARKHVQPFLPSQTQVVMLRSAPQEERHFMLCPEEQAQLGGCWGGRDPHEQHSFQERD